MTASLAGTFTTQQFTDAGKPLVNGRLYTLAHGTNVFKTAYTNYEGTVSHTYTADGAGGQYIGLNVRGELTAPLYLTTGSYDIRLCRANGSVVWTRRADPVADAAQSIVASFLDVGNPAGGAGLFSYNATAAYPVQSGGAKLREAVSPTDFPWLASGAGVVDATAAFQACFSWAAANGKRVHIPRPAVAFALSGSTITIPRNLEITADTGAKIKPSNWGAKTAISDQGVSARVLFSVIGDGGSAYEQAGSPLSARFSFTGATFQNDDTSFATRCFSGVHAFASVLIEGCEFLSFTNAGVFGAPVQTTGVHAESDAQTTLLKAEYIRNRIVSDTRDTGQSPKAFHTYNCQDGLQQGNHVYANGAGYCTRWAGGSVSTIPVPGRGLGNVKSIGNTYRPLALSEYNQVAKGCVVTVVGDTGIASASPAPHNMWDFFNCHGVTFNGNTAAGGGLAFFGHADLNNAPSGAQPALQGASGFSASGNSIINPSHNSVFNTGGDGNVESNRACKNVSISGTTVTCLPGYAPPVGAAFYYGFLTNNAAINGNIVQGLPVFIRTFFNSGLKVGDENILIDVPTTIQNEGTDASTQGTHAYGSVTYRGTAGSINKIDTLTMSVPYVRDMQAGVKLTSVWGERVNSGFMVNPAIVFSEYDLSSPVSEALVFTVTATLSPTLGTQSFAAWYVHKSGTSVAFVANTGSNDPDIAISLFGGRIFLTTTGGLSRTLGGTMTRVQ